MSATHASEFLDFEELPRLAESGYISIRKHDSGLKIYNYTARAAYCDAWTPETLACRGLILDHCGYVVARPFRKFFNLSQHLPESSPLPRLPVGFAFEAWEKLDGSLGVSFRNPESDRIEIATRGSFSSEQAGWATAWWRERHGNTEIPLGQTWLFEIIYPANRIVVNYGSRAELVLIAVIDNATGEDLPLPEWSGTSAKRFDAGSVEELLSSAPPGASFEGFVLRYPSTGQRVKVKLDEYVRLHRILTSCSNRTIWEALSSGGSLDDVLDHVPDEFYAWVRREETRQKEEFATIEARCRKTFETSGAAGMSRKGAAAIFTKQDNPAILFKMLDGKDYAPLIWKAIYPEQILPFAEDEP